MPTEHSLLRQSAMAVAVAACFPTLAWSGVARVDFAVGQVSATGTDGRVRALVRGAEIEEGELVATQQGRAQIRFKDGAYMSLQPGTEFKVDQFKFSGKSEGDAEDNVVMSLFKGGMRTITGLIGKFRKQNYRLNTTVATIGIRGTEYSVTYGNSITVHVTDGIIALENQGGTLELGSGQTGFVADGTTPPQRTDTPPALPPQGPTGGGGEDGGKPANPTNPIQDSSPILGLLTGTFAGNIAYSARNAPWPLSNWPNTQSTDPITLDSNGVLQSFLDTSEGTYSIDRGTLTAVSKGNDGVIAWGHWLGPGNFNADGSVEGSLMYPLHYVVGLPATSIPTSGTANYSALGSSVSCAGANCTAAAVNSASLMVMFGPSSYNVYMNLNYTVNGDNAGTYAHTASGSGSGQLFSASPMSGSNLYAYGFLSGAGAERAGAAWHSTVSGSSSTNVNGATAFKK